MHSEPLLPPENNLPEEECYVAGATHLQLSWCREALGQVVPHASDELVAPPLCQPVAPGCRRTRPHFPPLPCASPSIHRQGLSHGELVWE